MKKIGGNTEAVLQKFESTENAIGEAVKTWSDVVTIKGFLDMIGEDTDIGSFKTKLQQSTHVFICDFFPLPFLVESGNSRLIINGGVYDILFIDDPMGLSGHYEFYLKYTGGK